MMARETASRTVHSLGKDPEGEILFEGFVRAATAYGIAGVAVRFNHLFSLPWSRRSSITCARISTIGSPETLNHLVALPKEQLEEQRGARAAILSHDITVCIGLRERSR
jgi:hypothetical protein